MKNYLTIHGHFYQPPRENPWIETIEEQPSAHPAHDWNDRINSECYYPNGNSRILDASDRIVDIVNNYRNISFNFGPTLLSWMEVYAPETYELIIKADRESLAQHNNHGAAIAQCYNHTIMPLANEQDQRTQIKWGVADFIHRFGREPESIWLPETAINQTTLNILTEFNFKFIILSPYQAERVRPLTGGNDDWAGVQDGNIDIRRPYRCFARGAGGNKLQDRYIDIFFYHGPLSRAISFEHILRNAAKFSDNIEAAFGTKIGTKIVSVATDGETYGHHEQFGDLGLSYLLSMEAPVRDIIPTNFGEYLEHNPPEWEVELKKGPGGEGTAWSCAHGIGRWYRNCGCSTGGEDDWNQEWRQPLRQALDKLNESLLQICEKESKEIFHDFAAARDEYISVILDRSRENVDAYLNKHLQNPAGQNIRCKALCLMEIQRNAQLMFTSCGWFFTELSGLETVQILKYAARAIELADEFSDGFLEETFINNLSKARSNITQYKNGAWIYRNFVLPAKVSFSHIVNHYAISAMFDALQNSNKVFVYEIEDQLCENMKLENREVLFGKLCVTSQITRLSAEYAYVLINQDSGEQLDCIVHRLRNNDWDFAAAREAVVQIMQGNSPVIISEITKKIWRGKAYTLADMLPEEKQKIVDKILAMQLQDTYSIYKKIYQDNYGLMRMIARSGLKLPDELILPTKITFSRIIYNEISAFNIDEPATNFQDSITAAGLAENLDLQLELQEATNILQKLFVSIIERLLTKFSLPLVEKLEALIQVSEKLRLKLHKTPIQNALFKLLKRKVLPEIEKIIAGHSDKKKYDVIAGILRVAYSYKFNIKIYKDRLKSFENQFNQDPEYWP